MITYILHPSCFCDIWALCVSRITYMKFKNNIQDTFSFWFWHGVKKLRKMFFIKIVGSSPANILEKHSITGFILLLLRTFSEHLFYGSPPGFSNQYRNRNRVECSIKIFLWKVVKNPNENIAFRKNCSIFQRGFFQEHIQAADSVYMSYFPDQKLSIQSHTMGFPLAYLNKSEASS